MPIGVYERKIKEKIKLCHPDVKRHVEGICINCYSRVLKERNPQYKENQRLNTKKRYDRLGSKISNNKRVNYQRQWRVLAVLKLGAQCEYCGFNDMRALQIDHVNGDGHKERAVRKSICRNIALDLTDITRYQLLCANCNWIKRIENNEGTNRADYNEYILDLTEKLKNENK